MNVRLSRWLTPRSCKSIIRGHIQTPILNCQRTSPPRRTFHSCMYLKDANGCSCFTCISLSLSLSLSSCPLQLRSHVLEQQRSQRTRLLERTPGSLHLSPLTQPPSPSHSHSHSLSLSLSLSISALSLLSLLSLSLSLPSTLLILSHCLNLSFSLSPFIVFPFHVLSVSISLASPGPSSVTLLSLLCQSLLSLPLSLFFSVFQKLFCIHVSLGSRGWGPFMPGHP